MFIAHGGTDHPVNLHAAHAAQAADVAEQAATVAQRVAAHTAAVAQDTASALRYTQDALKRAGADKKDIAEVAKEAEKMEEEAGTKKHSSSEDSQDKSASSDKKSSNLDSEKEDASSSISKDDTDSTEETNIGADGRVKSSSSDSSASASGDSATPLDVNSQIVPYPSAVEPFGQEEPAKELTKASVKQSDSMVDKIENAQGTEAKRAVYRALTKLRGATIASYDGMAKGHLSNVDHYKKSQVARSSPHEAPCRRGVGHTHLGISQERHQEEADICRQQEDEGSSCASTSRTSLTSMS